MISPETLVLVWVALIAIEGVAKIIAGAASAERKRELRPSYDFGDVVVGLIYIGAAVAVVML